MHCFANKAGVWRGGTFHRHLIMQSAILRCSEQMYTETLELLLCRYSLYLHNRRRCFVTTLRESGCAVKAPSYLSADCWSWSWSLPSALGTETFLRGHAATPRGSPSVSEVNDAWTAGTLLSVNHMVMCKGSPLFWERTGWGCRHQTCKYRGARAN